MRKKGRLRRTWKKQVEEEMQAGEESRMTCRKKGRLRRTCKKQAEEEREAEEDM